MIAQNMATRMGADPLMVMQNLYVVHGNPGWSAKFLIACFNQCGRFSAIKYRFTGKPGMESWGCIAYATELATGEVVEGTEVTCKMAKAEGWSTKAGSKWKTMPEQMLRYRSATFLIRSTAPEIGMGLQTQDELKDVHGHAVTIESTVTTDDLTQRLTEPSAPSETDQPPALAPTTEPEDGSTESALREAFAKATTTEEVVDLADVLISNGEPEDVVSGIAAELIATMKESE